MSEKLQFVDFGAPDKFGAHLFRVELPAVRTESVRIVEDYSYCGLEGGLAKDEERVILTRPVWAGIADIARREFNDRLKAAKVTTGRWHTGTNLVDRLLGKELCVLAWATETANDDQLPVICSKWAALLLELLVFLEERDDVLQARVKRVGRGDLVGNRFRTAIGDLRFGGFLQFLAVGIGDVVNLRLIGQGFEKTLSEDVVDFVRGEVNRGDVTLGAAKFLPGIVEGASDERPAGLVGGEQVGDDDADVGFLAGGGQEIREGPRRDVGHGARADRPRGQILEVGRHFIQQDEDGVFAVEELEPGFFVGSLRAGGPELLEDVGRAKLQRDFTPEEMRRAVAAVERGHASSAEHLGVGVAAAVFLAQGGMPGEQAEADEQMGFAATHRLLEMEDGLRERGSTPIPRSHY